MTRLIDADALLNDISDLKKSPWFHENYFDHKNIRKEAIEIVEQLCIDKAPTIDAVPVETVCEMFGNEAPCNFGLFGVSVDDFMYSECGDWCESNCDKVPYTECWQKFFEAIEKWRKQNG